MTPSPRAAVALCERLGGDPRPFLGRGFLGLGRGCGTGVLFGTLLGLGMGKKVPSWDETRNEFVPKTEAQITLSFDHRSIDGGGASYQISR